MDEFRERGVCDGWGRCWRVRCFCGTEGVEGVVCDVSLVGDSYHPEGATRCGASGRFCGWIGEESVVRDILVIGALTVMRELRDVRFEGSGLETDAAMLDVVLHCTQRRRLLTSARSV